MESRHFRTHGINLFCPVLKCLVLVLDPRFTCAAAIFMNLLYKFLSCAVTSGHIHISLQTQTLLIIPNYGIDIAYYNTCYKNTTDSEIKNDETETKGLRKTCRNERSNRYSEIYQTHSVGVLPYKYREACWVRGP